MKSQKLITEYVLFWHRRDLRVEDNAGLFYALKESHKNVVPLFIFDPDILEKLDFEDRRVNFIALWLEKIKDQYQKLGSDLKIFYGKPQEVFAELCEKCHIQSVYTNHDYEPQAIARDQKIKLLLDKNGISFKTFKDQVIFEKFEVLTDQKKPYTVYTPYKKKWLAKINEFYLKSYPVDLYTQNLLNNTNSFFNIEFIFEYHQLEMMKSKSNNFKKIEFDFPVLDLSKKMLKEYAEKRDYPFLDQATSRLGVHLRFGTISIRELAREAQAHSEVWLSELIWRDFFMQILFHFPHVENQSFKPQFDQIQWRNDESEFQKWATGQTGYPLVDAGIRELLATGHMHNRVRMVVASFLTKHLLTYWTKGERFFAAHLLDYDLSANSGNWQWAAGTGCDAAPYFRVFNPASQIEKFDPDYKYVKKWVPEYGTLKYPKAMVEHSFARQRALETYKKGLL